MHTCLQPSYDPAAPSVGGNLDEHAVSGEHANIVDLHLAGKMGKKRLRRAFDLDSKHQSGKGLKHPTLFCWFFRHYRKSRPIVITRCPFAPVCSS